MKTITNWYLHQKIYLKLLPFLIFYLLIIFLFSSRVFIGDEFRYISFANNLLHGFYSPPYPAINLWNGPGYPIILVPFVYLKLPYLVFRLLNAFFLYCALIFTYKTCHTFCAQKNAFFITLGLGLYYPIYGDALLIVTEAFSWFLISVLCFLLIRCFKQKFLSGKLLCVTAFVIAYLAMTKIIFGYVILLMVFIAPIMFFSFAYRIYAKKILLIFIISFCFCLPWLFYTYNLTNKVFYWSNSGGMSLYTMSTPFQKELGDWDILGEAIPYPNHAVFVDSIATLNPIQRDAAYKARAFINIKQYPKKYFSNWLANIGRLIFSMPFTNKVQNTRTFLTIIPNMFVVVIMVFVFSVSIIKRIKYPVAFQLLIIFFGIYLIGCTTVSAYKRMFYITMPCWFVVIGYFFNVIITVNLKGKPSP